MVTHNIPKGKGTGLNSYESRIFTRRVLYNIALIILSYAIVYLLNVLLARLLSPRDYGDFRVALQVISYVALIILFGANLSLNQLLPKYIKNKEWGHAAGLVRIFSRRIVKVSIFLLIFAFLLFSTLLFFSAFFANITIHPVYYFLWLAPLSAASLFTINLLRCSGAGIRATFSSKVIAPILNVMLIFLALFVLKKIQIYHVLFAYGFSLSVILLIQLLWVHNIIPKEIKSSPPLFLKDKWFKLSLSMFKVNLFTTLLSSSGIIILDIVHPNEDAVGLLGVILVIASPVLIIYRAVLMIVRPILSANISKTERLQEILSNTYCIVLGSCGILCFLLIFFRHTLLAHFGQFYLAGSDDLVVCILGFAVLATTSISKAILTMSGNEQYLLKLLIVAFITNCFCASLFGYYYGVIGVLLATLAISLMYNIAIMFECKRRIGIKPFLIF